MRVPQRYDIHKEKFIMVSKLSTTSVWSCRLTLHTSNRWNAESHKALWALVISALWTPLQQRQVTCFLKKKKKKPCCAFTQQLNSLTTFKTKLPQGPLCFYQLTNIFLKHKNLTGQLSWFVKNEKYFRKAHGSQPCSRKASKSHGEAWRMPNLGINTQKKVKQRHK